MTVSRFRIFGPDGPWEVTLKGREEWALSHLMVAGDRGCTPIDTPGPRWSDYKFKLVRRGIEIATITEAHDGPYKGHHARYRLVSKVERLSIEPTPSAVARRAETEAAHV